jgi:hypothetical protein
LKRGLKDIKTRAEELANLKANLDKSEEDWLVDFDKASKEMAKSLPKVKEENATMLTKAAKEKSMQCEARC